MGCDIHTWVEKKNLNSQVWERVDLRENIFESGRHYGLFGWLADVRNYSAVTPLITVHRDLPKDLSENVKDAIDNWGSNGHSGCHVYARDLLSFDYQQMMEDRRVTINNNGGCTAAPGGGQQMTYAVFLGEWALAEIMRFCAIGPDDVRLVFCFDN